MPRCRRHEDRRLAPDDPACPAFTPSLDCATCGACCREAYDAVEVGARDPFVKKHPELIQISRLVRSIKRIDGRCPALEGQLGSFSCRVYADRPRTCRDFALGGRNCVDARQRVGLTP